MLDSACSRQERSAVTGYFARLSLLELRCRGLSGATSGEYAVSQR